MNREKRIGARDFVKNCRRHLQQLKNYDCSKRISDDLLHEVCNRLEDAHQQIAELEANNKDLKDENEILENRRGGARKTKELEAKKKVMKEELAASVLRHLKRAENEIIDAIGRLARTIETDKTGDSQNDK